MRYLILFNQTCIWIIARIFLLVSFSERKVYFQESLINDESGYVVAANHQSKLDPVVVFGAMPFRVFLRLAPVRFMAHREFFAVAFYRLFLEMWGAYPNKEIGNIEYGLSYSSKILADKGTINIFPEGTRVKIAGSVEPKRGVSVLASEPNTKLILCRINWHFNVFPHVSIIISAPKDCSGQTAQEIMDQIYTLA
jgi:1-acyl-sn-glycerol-3-phosphate acyltransferase